jgi:hypothetical protein
MKSMKIFKNSFVKLLTLLILGTSCTDFVEPNIPYATFDTGAYLRTITRTSTTFNFFDLSNSKFDITVEAVDAEDGKSVESVEVRVRHRRLVSGVGNVFIPAAGAGNAVVDVSVKTLTAADFKPNDQSRFLRANIQLTATEVINKLGLTLDEINGGDAFEIRLTLRDKKGRVFNDVNASGDVKGGAFFSSPFLYPVSVICPSDLGGTYAYSTLVKNSPFARSCDGKVLTGNVTWTRVGTSTGFTVSDASFGLFTCAGDTWGTGNVRINDACGVLSFAGTDKYGSTYTFTFISNDGTSLVFDWKNSDNESGTTTLTAASGKPWPETLK